jgi:hydroxyacylglutathione hydrolase
VVTRLARVGYDNVFGHLRGGIAAWKNSGKEVDTIERIDATEFAKRFAMRTSCVWWMSARMANTLPNMWMVRGMLRCNSSIRKWRPSARTRPNYVHCAGGYRSMIAASLLKSRGYHNLVEIRGGFNAIKNTDVKVTDHVCPSTLKK